MAVPTLDSLLVPFSTNMNDRLVASGVTLYHLSAGQVSGYTDLHEPYIESYNALIAARESGTRSESQTALKDACKFALLGYARDIYGIVQADNTISDADKILLGVHVRLAPGSIPRPGTQPGLHIDGADRRTVSVTIHDNTVTPHRAKPPGAVAAWVYSFVGTDYPVDPAEWNFEGACTGRRFSVVFDGDVPAGSKVWLCAAWINAKQEAGETSIPLSINLPGGGSEAEETMSIAA